MQSPRDLHWMKKKITQSLTHPSSELGEFDLKILKTAYLKLSWDDKKAFQRFFTFAYGHYSGKLTHAKWALAGAMLLPLLDLTTQQLNPTLRLLFMISLGSFLGFMVSRRLIKFSPSGNYYENLKHVNDTFKKIDQTLHLNSFFLQFTDTETSGLTLFSKRRSASPIIDNARTFSFTASPN